MKYLPLALSLTCVAAIHAHGAELLDPINATDTSYCISCAQEDAGYDARYQAGRAQESIGILDANDRTINRDLIAAEKAIAALTTESQQRFAQTEQTIAREVRLGNERLLAIETVLSTPSTPAGTVHAINRHDQRLSALEGGLAGLRDDLDNIDQASRRRDASLAAMPDLHIDDGDRVAIGLGLGESGGEAAFGLGAVIKSRFERQTVFVAAKAGTDASFNEHAIKASVNLSF